MIKNSQHMYISLQLNKTLLVLLVMLEGLMSYSEILNDILY